MISDFMLSSIACMIRQSAAAAGTNKIVRLREGNSNGGSSGSIMKWNRLASNQFFRAIIYFAIKPIYSNYDFIFNYLTDYHRHNSATI